MSQILFAFWIIVVITTTHFSLAAPNCNDIFSDNAICSNTSNKIVLDSQVENENRPLTVDISKFATEQPHDEYLKVSDEKLLNSSQYCIEPGYEKICSGKGQCINGKCLCENYDVFDADFNATLPYHYSGRFCEECPYCRAMRCENFLPCVNCLLILQEQSCDTFCRVQYSIVDYVIRNIDNDDKLCDTQAHNGCFLKFKYWYTKERSPVLEISKNYNCIAGTSILLILFWGVIVYIFIIMIIIPKFCLVYELEGVNKRIRSIVRFPVDIIRSRTN